jgi:hypothetical protein
LGVPSSILGAAQVISRLGNGLACGTCIKVTPTDRSLVKNAEPQIVTGECIAENYLEKVTDLIHLQC